MDNVKIYELENRGVFSAWQCIRVVERDKRGLTKKSKTRITILCCSCWLTS